MHKAKKSLGQNFLKSKLALNAMCTAAELTGKDIVLEIGPGKGALTEKLLENNVEVIAIEKDRELVKILSKKFEVEIKNKKLRLIEGDALEFEVEKYFSRKDNWKIVANIPYNITGAIFKKFLSSDIKPIFMVMLVQKEVAERIVARDGKESILSLSVKAYGQPKYIMKVSKKYFSPIPKVDSAIIAIKNISDENFTDKKSEKLFFDILKLGFAHKRKVLRKNLEGLISKESIKSMFEYLKIKENTRAEDLSLDTWLEMNKYLSKYIGN